MFKNMSQKRSSENESPLVSHIILCGKGENRFDAYGLLRVFIPAVKFSYKLSLIIRRSED